MTSMQVSNCLKAFSASFERYNSLPSLADTDISSLATQHVPRRVNLGGATIITEQYTAVSKLRELL